MPQLKSLLFFPTLEAAVAAMPAQYQRMLSLADKPPTQPPTAFPPPCPAGASHFVRPKVVHSEVPGLTDDARLVHFSGIVSILTTVDETGRTTDLWLKIPAGLGLDEAAAASVSGYKFKPATCSGVPVKVPLEVEVNFTNR